MALTLISDHVFRGEKRCIFPNCGQPEIAHRESADVRPPQIPHWFIGLRLCTCCGIGFNHPSHCLSPSWAKAVFAR